MAPVQEKQQAQLTGEILAEVAGLPFPEARVDGRLFQERAADVPESEAPSVPLKFPLQLGAFKLKLDSALVSEVLQYCRD